MTMFGSQWLASARGEASVVFTDSAVNTTSQTTYTFTNHPIGTAAANRKIIVAAECANNARTVSTITVGGVSAALISGTRVSEPSTTQVELWQADVPTGTTGTIVVAWSGVSGTRGSIGVWAVYGAGSVEHAVAIDNSSPYNQDVVVPAGGIIVAACIGITATSFTWDSPMVESYDELIEHTTYHSGAHYASAAGETVTVVMTPSTVDAHAMAAVSFGPA
jgi:hypothetical protein